MDTKNIIKELEKINIPYEIAVGCLFCPKYNRSHSAKEKTFALFCAKNKIHYCKDWHYITKATNLWTTTGNINELLNNLLEFYYTHYDN